MPCDTRLRAGQTISDRKVEVKRVVATVADFLARGRVTAKVGPQGAVAFLGVPDDERNGVSDACIYRLVMATGSSLAKAAIARAEMMAGRTVNRQLVGQGVHAHADAKGNLVWHDHKG